jgi:2-hydroxychromene-2-carboxylate isomerase
MTKAKWYFDFISPFAYLQFAQFPKLPSNLEITPVPAVFGAILQHWGQLGPAEIPTKRRFVYRFFQWNADQLGIPFTMPPMHPFNPIPALRLCTAAGAGIEHTQAVFNLIYGKGIQPDSPEGIQLIGDALDISNPEISMQDPVVKDTLRANTAQATSDGVFGVPSFVINGEIFWGGDSTEMMLDFLENPELFETSEMKRISNMEMGLIRKK